MPTSREIVLNTALSGEELKEIIRADIERLLTAEGALVSNTAYGRCAYILALKLYTGNPFFPESLTKLDSRPAPAKDIEAHPPLSAIESPPLPADTHKRALGGTVLHRAIDSPNAERVRLGIPVPVQVEQQDGTRTIERIIYPRPAPFVGAEAMDEKSQVMDESEARAKGYNIIEVDE